MSETIFPAFTFVKDGVFYFKRERGFLVSVQRAVAGQGKRAFARYVGCGVQRSAVER